MTTYQIIALILSALGVILVFYFVRAGKLRERYTWWWLILLVAISVATINLSKTKTIARALGFEQASNLLLVAATAALIAIVLTLSVTMTIFEERQRRHAEEIALLHQAIRELKSESHNTSNPK